MGYTNTLKSIFVHGDDIYVVGYIEGNWKQIPTVWKNGVATSLTEGNGGQAYAVYVK